MTTAFWLSLSLLTYFTLWVERLREENYQLRRDLRVLKEEYSKPKSEEGKP